MVAEWGEKGTTYSHAVDYQQLLKTLLGRFPYRLDTNFEKMDRIEHDGLEAFKTKVLNSRINGKTILQWSKILRKPEAPRNREALREFLGL